MTSPFGFIGPQMGPQGMPIGPMPPPPPPNGAGLAGMAPPQPPMPPLGMDPATNNQPLQFNTSKNKPPMAIPGRDDVRESGDKRKDRGNSRERDDSVSSDGSGIGSMPQNMDMMGANMMGSGPMGFNPMMPMGGDPNMMMMGPMGPMGFGYMPGMPTTDIMGQGLSMPATKDILTYKACTLYPPNPQAPPPTTRERPPGCRTIFIGGLPDNCTEDILKEIFEAFGVICTLRMSKKNFAHLRYELEESVERALYISGFRMKIENKDDKPNTGRLHVDYAQARDDLYEWECRQRSLMREERHRQRVQDDTLRPPSPPPVIHYSDHEAGTLMDQLKGDDSFMTGTQILITWLERGDCNRRSSNNFYSMVQCVNSHVRRLMNEKAQHDQEFQEVKEKFQQRLEGILKQCKFCI